MDEVEYNNAVASLQDAVHFGMEALSAEMKETSESLDSQIKNGQDLVSTVTDAFDEAIDSFEATFAKLENAVAAVHAGVASHCEQSLSLLADARDEQDVAAEQVDEALEEFDEYVEEIVETADGIKKAVAELFKDLLNSSIQVISEKIIGPVESFRTEAMQQVQRLLDDKVHNPVNEQLDEIVEEALVDLKSAIDEAISQLTEGLVEFRSNVIENADTAAQDRSVSSQLREMLDEALAPVMRALERVMSLGDSVGISIG